MPKFEIPDDFLREYAETERIQAEADLLRGISKDIKDKRDKRI